MHYNALKELYGEENIFTIDLRPGIAKYSERYIAYGKYKNLFDRLCRWLQGNMMFISNRIIKDICHVIRTNDIQVVFVEDSVFGNLVREIKSSFPNVKVVSFYHDVKANLYPQWRKQEKCFLHKIDPTIGIIQEKINQSEADINIVFNQRDAEMFKQYYGRYPEAQVPLPAPIPTISEELRGKCASPNSKKKLLFVGKNYYPNLVGFKWFVDYVLPELSDNIQIDVVGRGLEKLREEYNDSRINIVGGVDSLTPYYQNADIVFAPLFDGGGMKSKTVEAISFGKMFIGTRESLFGFWEEMDDSIRYKTVFQADEPQEWIDIINRLVESEIPKFNEGVFSLFVEKFSYEATREQFAVLLDKGGKCE